MMVLILTGGDTDAVIAVAGGLSLSPMLVFQVDLTQRASQSSYEQPVLPVGQAMGERLETQIHLILHGLLSKKARPS